MNKLLSKLLIGLVATLFALSLFSFIVVKLTNQVRYEHYWTDLFEPPIRFLTEHPMALATIQSRAVTIQPLSQLNPSELTMQRLFADQVVVQDDQNGVSALKLMNDPDFVMRVDTRLDGRELYLLYVKVMQLSLAFMEGTEITLEQLESMLAIEVELLDPEEGHDLPEYVLNELVQSSFNIYVDDSDTIAFVRAQSGEIYKIAFPDAFSPFSLLVSLMLFALSVGCLGLLVNNALKGIDRQLRNVETVTSRIARGELDARVKRASDSDALSRLGTSFNAMAEHIQRLMLVQKEMIHAVSHELRTPVARIRFGVQMIEDCEDKSELRKQLKGIDGDIQELDELIDEILTYARLEQGGPVLAFHEANVMEIVEQVVQEQSSVKPEMTIEAEYKTESELWKDSEVEARYIHRSIQNLVGNATRYAKSHVKVVCSFDKETCRVDVEDDGPGIPEENWESVFTPFSRLDDSRTRSSGGYGLGLSIVRRILYWHGGQAFLGRSDMGGAKFSLVWPRKQQAPD